MPTLHLHGPPQLAFDGRTPLALAPREAALLAWLHLQGPTPRQHIAGLLWPAGSEAQARANLRQALVRLRRAAGELVVEPQGLLQLAPGLVLAAAEGRPLLGPLAFDDAPEFAAWLAARRDEALRQHQREQLERARQGLDRGLLDQAQAAADAVLASHPESEEAWRLRMEVFESRGDRASALQAWDECRLALRAAFGVLPSPATQALGERLLRAPAAATAPAGLPATLRRPPLLVGRQQALAELQRGLVLGHASVVLGPGGIGKTRLLAAAAATFEPALVVGARAGDALRPGALVQRLLAAALPRFAPPLDADTQAELARVLPALPGAALPDLKSALEHQRVLGAITRTVQACHAAGLRLLVLDDLQFADDASLEALRSLAVAVLPRDAEPGLRLLCAARPDELPAAAAALLELLLQSGRGQRLELPPLATPQLHELLRALALPEGAALDLDALAAALHAQLGGNPAFVLESLKSLWLDGMAAWVPGQPLPVPPTLRESVNRRLQRLDPSALQLAQLAAVAQADFSLGLAASAFERSPLALAPLLQALEAAQVFDGQAFGHELVADAVQRSLPRALVPLLHRQVAGYLGCTQPPPAASIAHHLQAAGDAQAAVPWLLQAARQAAGQWQMRTAARAYETAAPLLQAAGQAEPAFDAWREAARCWIVAGEAPATDRALQAAEALAASPRQQVLVLSTRITWGFNHGRTVQAVAQAQRLARALPGAADVLSADELAQALLSCNMAASSGPDPQALVPMAEALRPRAAGEPRLAARIDLAQGLSLHWAGQVAQARPLLRRAWDAALAAGWYSELVNVGNQRIRVEALAGDVPLALALCQDTRAAVQRAGGGPGFEADVLHQEVLLQLVAGQPQAALQALQRCAELHQKRSHPPVGFNAAATALAWAMLGRAERAEAVLAAAGPLPAEPTSGAAFLALARIRLLRLAGQPVQAALALAAERLASRDGLMACRLAVQQARCQAPAGRLVAELEARGLQALLASARLAQGLAAGGVGDPWCDEPAAWQAQGAAWVRRAADTLHDAADRQAFCEGHPLHRQLLQGDQPLANRP